jgi:hypothetical protein
MPDIVFFKTITVNGSPDRKFEEAVTTKSTFGPAPRPLGVNTPHVRDGVYLALVRDVNRHKQGTSPAKGPGLIRETPVLEVIH